jgi:hypothetical protein
MRALAISVVVLMTLAGPVSAGSVSISRGGQADVIVLEAVDATRAEVIGALSKRFGIEIEGEVSASSRETRMSMMWRGRVDQLIGRILKTESYVLTGGTTENGAPGRIVFLASQEAPKAAQGQVVARQAGEPVSREAKTSGTVTAAADAADAGTGLLDLPSSGLVASAQGAASAGADANGMGGSEAGGDGASALGPGLALAGNHAMMLAQQFGIGHVGAGGGGFHPAAPGNIDMQSLHQKVALDAQGLAASLRSICIGDGCGTSSK